MKECNADTVTVELSLLLVFSSISLFCPLSTFPGVPSVVVARVTQSALAQLAEQPAPTPASDAPSSPPPAANPDFQSPSGTATKDTVMASALQFVDDKGGNAAGSDAVPFDTDGAAATEVPPLSEDAGLFEKAKHYIARGRAYKEDKFKSLRPWGEFFNRNEFSVPSKLEAFSRIHRNYTHFHSNYVVLVAVLSSYILITNVVFLLAMVLCTAGYYYTRMRSAAGDPIKIGSKELSPTQAYAGLLVGTLFLFYWTNGSSTIFWLVTTALLAVFGHAATRRPVDDNPFANLPV